MDRRRVRPPVSNDEIVYGIHAVAEALRAGEHFRRVHIGKQRTREPQVQEIIEAARERGGNVRFEEAAFFERFPFKAHQQVVAFSTPFDYARLEDLLAAPRPRLIVALDHLTDPHNLGAIVRTAEAAGATGIVIPERRSVGVNATVRKASAGAVAHLPIAQVTNLAAALRKMKESHIWVAGAAGEAFAKPYTRAELTGDVCLVIGAEGAGLAELVRKQCDFLVSIPMHGRTGSLNASVAAGVLLYEVLRQRGQAEEAHASVASEGQSPAAVVDAASRTLL
ncbi:MAG: 23S rRNA (guanosine(2251)-2'-O)-methyltransferase RlmB [bacterium]|nr:23S rRNA (guanosine(2251)-2'-O)-methyltransferase RlmB [bacterium]